MDLILIGPGRAGLSVALAAIEADHVIAGVLGRDRARSEEAAERLGATPLEWDRDLPGADLALVAVRDDAIESVAERLTGRAGAVTGAVHLSGLARASALEALGVPIGSFHPLQTLPAPEVGARRLAGAHVAITSDDDLLADRLFAFAASLGMHPFELLDEQKALYHAAAAASANFTLTALSMAHRLFIAAGVDPTVAEPLVRAVIDNALNMGPDDALTGPVARSDVGTVRAQVEAVRAAVPDMAGHFEAMVRATATAAGTLEVIEEALR